MAKQLQIRGGTTVQHSTFTGALREITIDTDKDVVVVHDGTTVGGFPLAKQTSVDSKVTKVTSTDNAIVRFNGTTGDVQNSGVIIDDNNNVGIGVTPSAWIFNTLQINGCHISSNGLAHSEIGMNTGYSGGNDVYLDGANSAVKYIQRYDGAHLWQAAPPGPAGNPITWNTAMTLKSSGNLLLGTSTDNGVDKLQVNGSIKNVLQQTTVSYSNSGVFADTVEYTKTYNSNAGAGIAGSVFGDVPMIGELYAIEHGTGKYLRATIFKASSSANVDVTVHASSGLALVATNSGGTIQLGGYTVGSNVRMMTKLRKIY